MPSSSGEQQEIFGVIYKVTNVQNNKCYIGQTVNDFEKYKFSQIRNALKENSNRPFWRALKKYGEENFIWEIIDKAINRKELDEKEFEYIWLYCSDYNLYGYNIKPGGSSQSGWHHSEETKRKLIGIKRSSETKKKISDFQKGKPKSKEFIENMSKSRKGKKKPDGFGVKISKALKNKPKPKFKNRKWINKDNVNKFISREEIEFYLNNGWIIGRKNETIEKISKASLGKKHSKESIEKQKETKKRNNKPPWNKGLTKEIDERVKKNYENRGNK